jgi:hypothetical protein
MTLIDMIGIATALLTSVGGAAAIIFALSSWLGKVWANRILEKDRLKYGSEIERLKSELESDRQKNQLIFSLYFEGQFKLYNDLWVVLVELRHSVEQLWNEADKRNLRNFVKFLKKASHQIEISALLIEPNDYIEIKKTLRKFEEYRIGKNKLISMRQNEDISPEEIKRIVEVNHEHKDSIDKFTVMMLDRMRSQIRGAGVFPFESEENN